MVRRTVQTCLPAVLVVVVLFAAGSGRAVGSASSRLSATGIAAGLGHTCALTNTGGVKCWGANEHDQLGQGERKPADSSTPVDVPGLSSGVTAITAGIRHSCALTIAGVRCWGADKGGALGDGTATRRYTPVDVSGLGGGVTAIAAGSDHSCALMIGGGVKCWGYNSAGELGDGTTTDRWTPVDVSGLSSGAGAIAAGGIWSCALTAGGGVKCWGGFPTRRLTPVDVPGLGGGVTAITASCALTSAGGVRCWGADLTPVDVPGLNSGVASIATGSGHSCALMRTGGVKCWGLNDFGELGNGTTRSSSTPVGVSHLSSGVTAIAAGSVHTCALMDTGALECWGSNGNGELGDGTTVNRLTPVGVVGFRAANATLAIVSRSITVTPARIAALKLRCGSQARCRGALTLIAARAKLGGRTFSVAAGRAQMVVVNLTSHAFGLLVGMKRMPAQVRLSYAQPDGGTTSRTRTIMLSAPKLKP